MWPPAASDVKHAPGITARWVADRPGALAHHEPASRRASLVLRGEVEDGIAPRDHDIERLVILRKPHDHIEEPQPTILLGPGRSKVGSLFVIQHLEVEAVMADDEWCCTRTRRQLHCIRWGQDRSPPGRACGEVDPPHVGQAEVVDVRVHRRDHQVAGEDRPVVPSLVLSPRTEEVGAVQRVSRPPSGCRIQRRAVGDAQVDRLDDFHLVSHHAPL